jgi:hypothetical protein
VTSGSILGSSTVLRCRQRESCATQGVEFSHDAHGETEVLVKNGTKPAKDEEHKESTVLRIPYSVLLLEKVSVVLEGQCG